MPVVRWDKAKRPTPVKDFSNWVKRAMPKAKPKKKARYMEPDDVYVINGTKYEGFNRKRK